MPNSGADERDGTEGICMVSRLFRAGDSEIDSKAGDTKTHQHFFFSSERTSRTLRVAAPMSSEMNRNRSACSGPATCPPEWLSAPPEWSSSSDLRYLPICAAPLAVSGPSLLYLGMTTCGLLLVVQRLFRCKNTSIRRKNKHFLAFFAVL